MTSQSLSDRDYELISAYLDGEVDSRQKKAVEMRLAQDVQFKSAYDQISQTRRLLRNQPFLRAPRNYTLSPKMVSTSQTPVRAFLPFPSLLRTVSALASILFFILFGLNWFAVGRMMSAAPMESGEALFQTASTAVVEEQSSSSGNVPKEEQPMSKSMPTLVPARKAVSPPSFESGGMGGGEGTGAESGIEAPLLEPYTGTLLLPSSEAVTSTTPSATPQALSDIETQNEITPSGLSLTESQNAPENEKVRYWIAGMQWEWIIKQLLYGFLAISFAVIAIRYRKRRV